jgi:hypothetical protein
MNCALIMASKGPLVLLRIGCPWKGQAVLSQGGHKCKSIKNKGNMANALGPVVILCYIYSLSL